MIRRMDIVAKHVQVEMHAHWRNDRVLKWCNQQGIHVSAYAPLSSPSTMANMEKDVPNLMQVFKPGLQQSGSAVAVLSSATVHSPCVPQSHTCVWVANAHYRENVLHRQRLCMC